MHEHPRLALYPRFFVLSLATALVTTVVVWAKSRKFPRPYGLLIVTDLLLVSFDLILLATQGQGVKPVGYRSLQWKETDVANLAILTRVAVPADTDQPVQVVVDLTSPSGLSQPTSVETPGVPIVRIFGSGYVFFVTAQLNASAFDIVPQEQPERSLDWPGGFTWTLTPKYTGYQSIEVMVTGRWISRGGGPAIERLLARQSFSFDVAATPSSFFVTPVVVVLFVVLSALLNVPWIAELLKKRQETKKKETGT